MQEIVGRYKTIRTDDGAEVPWYVIPFDKQGRCKAPRTRGSLLNALDDGDFTHVFLFSHGWNNDWSMASKRYEDFIDGFVKLRMDAGLTRPATYRPLLVGVFWPSTSLVLPWETGPSFAASDETQQVAERDAFEDDFDRSVDAIAEELPEESLDRFYELVGADALSADGIRELAALLSPILDDDDEVSADGAESSDLAEAWEAGAALMKARARESDDFDDEEEDFGVAAPVVSRAAPQAAAGILSMLDPRHAIRTATVWIMKDRAGRVGARGVHPLLCEILDSCKASVHLVGHSYGCKVLLSAVACGPLPRPVTSALLLQPAVSHLAFAKNADGKGHPGGYRVVLDRICQPILTTFSSRDFPLSKVFHLAVRRRSDLGEQRIAAAPPGRFAALGGYGPGGMKPLEAETIMLKEPGQSYEELQTPGLKILALNGSRHITGHGVITQPATYWALHEQVRLSSSVARQSTTIAE
jgi:hypothetical protein